MSTAAGGAPPTLPLWVEAVRQLRRRRTVITLALLAALPVIVVLAFTLGSGTGGASTYVDLAQQGAVNLAVFVLFASTSLLIVVVVALFYGDTVSSEASWGTLRYLLAAPVPRLRLLRQKLLVALASSIGALLLLVVSSLVVGALAYGWHPLQTTLGGSLAAWPAVARIFAGAGYLFVSTLWVAGAALWLSTLTDAPLGAVGGAVGIVILSTILDSITALGRYRSALPTHFQFAWSGLIADPARYHDMAEGAVVSLSYAVVLFTLAFWHFARKDVLS